MTKEKVEQSDIKTEVDARVEELKEQREAEEKKQKVVMFTFEDPDTAGIFLDFLKANNVVLENHIHKGFTHTFGKAADPTITYQYNNDNEITGVTITSVSKAKGTVLQLDGLGGLESVDFDTLVTGDIYAQFRDRAVVIYRRAEGEADYHLGSAVSFDDVVRLMEEKDFEEDIPETNLKVNK